MATVTKKKAPAKAAAKAAPKRTLNRTPMIDREDFLSIVSEETQFIRKDAKVAVDGVVRAIRKCLAEGKNVSLFGLGRFIVIEREARIGRNPATGESVEIPAKQKVLFKATPSLKSLVNGEESDENDETEEGTEE